MKNANEFLKHKGVTSKLLSPMTGALILGSIRQNSLMFQKI